MDVDLSKEGDRFAAREVLGAILKPWTITHTLEEIGEIFDRHGVCWGPYQTFMQLVDEDPRCSTENPMFEQVEQPGIGDLPDGRLAAPLLRARAPARRPAPRCWASTPTRSSPSLLSLSETEIGRLHDDGVVAGPTAVAA